MDTCAGAGQQGDKDGGRALVLLLDHIRARRPYMRLLERWTRRLQLSGMLLLGRRTLVILQGDHLGLKVDPSPGGAGGPQDSHSRGHMTV